jgi:hypothetical protein
MKLAGLERAARLAGESFGHEDMPAFSGPVFGAPSHSRRLWWFAAAIALIGFAVLALR